MKKPIVLTAHAKKRLQDRRIDPSWIEATVRAPEWTEQDPLDSAVERRFRAVPEFGRRVLRVVRGDKFECPRYKYTVRSEREAKAMTDISYDAEADAVYITVAPGKVDRTEETGPFIYDVDADGQHIVGIEFLSASKVLAPGDWKKAGPPGDAQVGAAV